MSHRDDFPPHTATVRAVMIVILTLSAALAVGGVWALVEIVVAVFRWLFT